jgi:hypothetical protein
MISISGSLLGREDRLDADLGQLELGRPWFVAFVQFTEGAAAEPVELRPVLVDRPLAVQHHDVVEIVTDLDGVRGRLVPVSVSVKLVEPVSTAAPFPPSSRTNFW